MKKRKIDIFFVLCKCDNCLAENPNGIKFAANPMTKFFHIDKLTTHDAVWKVTVQQATNLEELKEIRYFN